MDDNLRVLIDEKLREIISDPDFIYKSFTYPKDVDERQNHVNRAENVRKPLYALKNNDERISHQIEQDFLGIMRKITEYFKLTEDFEGKVSDVERLNNAILVKSLLGNRIFDSTKKRRSFLKEFPLYYTLCMLCDFRDRDLNRPIQGNDLIDVISLALPIVYFDIVVAEKYFITLAKQVKLDQMYGTILLRRLEDLEQYLDKLSL